MRLKALPFLLSILLLSFFLSVLVGSVRLQPELILMHLLGLKDDDDVLGVIVDLRMVRTAAALLTGASLGVAGTLLQSLFRNPLADPFVLGISSGSSLAIALALVLGLGLGMVATYDPFALYVAAAIGALATSFTIIAISSIARTAVGLVLAGVMISYLNAGITTIIITTSDLETVRAFAFWTLGSFSAAKWSLIQPVFPLMMAGLVAAFFTAKPLNALAFGEDSASSMGVWVRGARVAVVTAASVVVAAATVVSGPVGFIGLASPHLVRFVTKTSDNRITIPFSALTGATIALLADIAARNIMPPLDLPITAITSTFGAPLILLLLLRGGKQR